MYGLLISVAEEPSTNAELHWYELEYNLGQLKMQISKKI